VGVIIHGFEFSGRLLYLDARGRGGGRRSDVYLFEPTES
jgi:hypothetical protein